MDYIAARLPASVSVRALAQASDCDCPARAVPPAVAACDTPSAPDDHDDASVRIFSPCPIRPFSTVSFQARASCSSFAPHCRPQVGFFIDAPSVYGERTMSDVFANVAAMHNATGGWHPSHLTRHTSHVTRYTSHLTCHTSHLKAHTSHLTPHTPQSTLHTSHLTPHTSHVTPHLRLSFPPQLRVHGIPPPCFGVPVLLRPAQLAAHHNANLHLELSQRQLADPKHRVF